MKVLFCTDGSQTSYNAIQNYMNIAKPDTAIDIICVIDWSFLPDNTVIEDSGFTSACRNIADDILKYSSDLISSKGFDVGKLIKLCGNAVECILEQLQTGKYDTVIVGSHGKKGIQRWIGSVSKSVLHEGETNTYISTNKQCCKKVLFIADGSEYAIQTVHQTLGLLNIEGSDIYICSVSENPELLFIKGTLDSNWLNTIKNQQNSYSKTAILKLAEVFKHNGFNIAESKVLDGIPAKCILGYAKKNNINLIVTGVKKRSRIQKFLLDSVSKRVLENTECDMFVNFML